MAESDTWTRTCTIFDVPLSKKTQVITIANKIWTNFKSKLTSLYVYKKPLKKRKRRSDADPLKKYEYITPEVWKRFKAMRMTKEFQASSELAAERQKKNKYPHRMSRGGYRKVRLKLEKKSLEAKKSGKSAPKIRRGDLWIEGRVNKNRECLNSETDAAIERINLVNEQVAKGEFLPSGKVDVLTKALGTDEHYGRVRGVWGSSGA
ncbi:uncharacterized protein LOC141631628 [Silene latifolia]|uniref:uncharacterized protein LOC141631628 n=1 Tax=Silene latifolia TaxID=37657 RepID=UPI003D77FFFF